MAADVVPALREEISRSFQNGVMRDGRALQVSKRIRDGTATFKDAHTYAESLGENLSRALVRTLREDNLPNGRLYYNIAQRTVIPALKDNYNMVNEVAKDIQELSDKAAGVGLKSVAAEFPETRINGLIDKMTEDGITFENVIKWLQEPIVNNSEAFADDFVRANAKFRSDVGLKATITRIVAPGCCPWCEEKAGTYDYDKAPDDIYQRHEYCRCTVTYQSGRRSQDVWSKRTWESSKEELDRRKSIGQQAVKSSQERINEIRQLQRDEAIRDFMDQTGYSRETARASTRNKDPVQVQEEIKRIIERRKRIGR